MPGGVLGGVLAVPRDVPEHRPEGAPSGHIIEVDLDQIESLLWGSPRQFQGFGGEGFSPRIPRARTASKDNPVFHADPVDVDKRTSVLNRPRRKDLLEQSLRRDGSGGENDQEHRGAKGQFPGNLREVGIIADLNPQPVLAQRQRSARVGRCVDRRFLERAEVRQVPLDLNLDRSIRSQQEGGVVDFARSVVRPPGASDEDSGVAFHREGGHRRDRGVSGDQGHSVDPVPRGVSEKEQLWEDVEVGRVRLDDGGQPAQIRCQVAPARRQLRQQYVHQ